MKSKYSGLVLDGRYKFADKMTRSGRYTFKNIYNGKTVELTTRQIADVVSGKTNLSKIMSRRIGAKTKWVSNYTVKTFNAQKRKYAQGGK